MQRSTSLGVEKPPPKDQSVQSYIEFLDGDTAWLLRSLDTVVMATRNPASKNQLRLVVEIPIIYKV